MKTVNLWLLCGTVTLFTAAPPVSAQIPPSLDLQLLAGVNIRGTVGSVYVVQSLSYGEDPNATSLTNYAWYFANSGAMTHPVEQKAPNPWGLYDMAGNVWEWCSDWQGAYPGGFAIDPPGPVSNPIGVKIIRGGAWDESENNCRSAKPMSFGVSPFLKDFILGFRVVLACP